MINCDILWSIRHRRPTVTLQVHARDTKVLDAIEQIVKGDSPVPVSVTSYAIGEGTVIQVQAGDLHHGDAKVPRIVRDLERRLRRLKLNITTSNATGDKRV